MKRWTEVTIVSILFIFLIVAKRSVFCPYMMIAVFFSKMVFISLPPRASLLYNLSSTHIKVCFNNAHWSGAVNNLCVWNAASLIMICLISFNPWLKFYFLSTLKANQSSCSYCFFAFKFLLVTFVFSSLVSYSLYSCVFEPFLSVFLRVWENGEVNWCV